VFAARDREASRAEARNEGEILGEGAAPTSYGGCKLPHAVGSPKTILAHFQASKRHLQEAVLATRTAT